MRTIEKVIFDTNILRNTEPEHFLGGRDILTKFLQSAEIVIPDIVIDEIRNQKRKKLEENKSKFLSNPFHWIRGVNKEETQAFDIEDHITELQDKEEIGYTLIELTDYSILKIMKELALRKLPPFEDADSTDKWFKDAYLYFTVLEYLQKITDKYIFVCTKDTRLTEAFQKHSNIRVIKDYEEFKDQSITWLIDSYFLEKLSETFHILITLDDILDYWNNIDGDQILLIQVEEKIMVVKIEEREVVTFQNTKEYKPLIEELICSQSYSETHKIAKWFLSNSSNGIMWFSDDDIESIFQALFDNDQISGAYWYSVKEFYLKLFEGKSSILKPELRKKMQELIDKPTLYK